MNSEEAVKELQEAMTIKLNRLIGYT